MKEDNLQVAVFPTEKSKAMFITPERILRDIKKEMDLCHWTEFGDRDIIGFWYIYAGLARSSWIWGVYSIGGIKKMFFSSAEENKLHKQNQISDPGQGA